MPRVVIVCTEYGPESMAKQLAVSPLAEDTRIFVWYKTEGKSISCVWRDFVLPISKYVEERHTSDDVQNFVEEYDDLDEGLCGVIIPEKFATRTSEIICDTELQEGSELKITCFPKETLKPNNLDFENLGTLRKELLKCDLENSKKVTKKLRDTSSSEPVVLTSADQKSLTRIRSIANDAVRLCLINGPHTNGVFHITTTEAYPKEGPPHLVWYDVKEGETLSKDMVSRNETAKSGSGSGTQLILTCSKAQLESAGLADIKPFIELWAVTFQISRLGNGEKGIGVSEFDETAFEDALAEKFDVKGESVEAKVIAGSLKVTVSFDSEEAANSAAEVAGSGLGPLCREYAHSQPPLVLPIPSHSHKSNFTPA